MFGASGSQTLSRGQWQLSVTTRYLKSDDHFRGTEYQAERLQLANYVVNDQRMVDVGATWALSPRWSLAVSVPFVSASWSIPLPTRPTPGPRSRQEASGLGDVSAVARYWVRDPARHGRANVSVGVGIKAPTGRHDVTDVYPDLTGANPADKAVDQSIQPGDGGWGLVLDLQAYGRLRRATLFGSATYLANPRDTNGTPSIVAGLGLSSDPRFAGVLVNSVPDQYVARIGVAFPVARRLSVSGAFRVEGLPRYDLLGASHGWRRPGYETFFEPGLVLSTRSGNWSLYVPVGIVRNRQPNPYTGLRGDATFPDYVFLAGWSYRFGESAPGSPARPREESAGPLGSAEVVHCSP